MTLTNRQKYDYRDIDRGELKLIRVGHALWAILRMERRARTSGKSLKFHSVSEERPLYEAIETIIRLKREYRAELKVRRAAESASTRERFRLINTTEKEHLLVEMRGE